MRIRVPFKCILLCRKALSCVLVLCFGVFTVVGPVESQTIAIPSFGLTTPFQPPVLRGMMIHPENPLLFDFIVDRGQEGINGTVLADTSTKLIKYFLTSMTIPDKDAWVNLSPTEKDRIIPDALGQTEMGRQMLEQDYVLKQLAASLTNPDTELGKKYWDAVNKAKTLDVGRWTLEKTTSDQRPATSVQPLTASVQPPATSDFNKVWIVPDGATVVEKDGFAYITESKLTVMLDEEYQAVGAYCNTPLQKNTGSSAVSISTQVFRDLILPKLIEEVNTGKNFAATRQVYQSVILAAWYKRALKDSLLGRIYADKSKVAGVETDVKDIKQKVYEQYLEAFKKGAYNVIKEEDGPDGELIPRKYFSGGTIMAVEPKVIRSSSLVLDVLREVVAGLAERHPWVLASFVVSFLKIDTTEIFPTKARLQRLLSAAVLDVAGFQIDNFDGFEKDDPLQSLILKNTFPDPKKFAEVTQTLQAGGRESIKSQIWENVQKVSSVDLSSDDRDYLNMVIDRLLEHIESLDMFWTRSGDITIKFLHFKNSFVGKDTDILTETIKNLIEAKKISGNGKEIIVERIAPEDDTTSPPSQPLIHPGQHTYSVRWGTQEYNIKIGSNIQPINPRLENQATILQHLNRNGGDSHIAKLLFSGVVQGHTVIVMTHMKGSSLQDRINFEARPFSYSDSLEFAKELAKAVEVVHNAGVIIADLTPGNIQVWHDPDTGQIKVFLYDFDVSIMPGYDWNKDPSQLSDNLQHLIRISQRKAFDSSGNVIELDMKNVNSSLDIVYSGKAIFSVMTSKALNNVADVTEQKITNQALRGIIIKALRSYGTEDGYQNIKEVLRDLNALPDTSPDVESLSASSATSARQAVDKSTVGGIDFDPSKLNLKIQRDKYGTPINLPQPNLKDIDNIQGLFPVLINIAPVNARTLPILGQLQASQSAAVLPQS